MTADHSCERITLQAPSVFPSFYNHPGAKSDSKTNTIFNRTKVLEKGLIFLVMPKKLPCHLGCLRPGATIDKEVGRGLILLDASSILDKNQPQVDNTVPQTYQTHKLLGSKVSPSQTLARTYSCHSENQQQLFPPRSTLWVS